MGRVGPRVKLDCVTVPRTPQELEERIENALEGEDPEAWLALWHASQGGERRNRRFELMAAVLPFSRPEPINVLDMCAGPGDLGRFIHAAYPHARIDAVDRDPFLLALGGVVNRRRGIQTRLFTRDGWDPGWYEGLDRRYHVIAAATALHWFDVERLGGLFRDFWRLLRPGGVLVFSEPHAPQPALSPGYASWLESNGSADDAQGTWDGFWNRANALLGYDHRAVLETLPAERKMIGDDGIDAEQYFALLRSAGFAGLDVIDRSGTTITIAALKE